MSQADGHDGLSRNGGARVSSKRPRLVVPCAPGASRTAGRGEDCTVPRGCRKVRRVVSRLKWGGHRGSGGDSPRPRRPLANRVAGSPGSLAVRGESPA